MLIDLSNKVAIVTGAGRGIGLEIAKTLAAEGVRVVIADLRPDLLSSAGELWREKGWDGLQLPLDVRQAESCNRVVAEAEQRFGRVDILVNNAGIASGSRVELLDEAVWNANLDINLSGTMRMCKAVVPVMKRQKAGRILNAASFAAIIPSVGGAAYAASKAGVESLTRVLAGEMGPYGVTVNAYAPGMILTDMNGFANRSPAEQDKLLNSLTLRRWGEPKDVAQLICFLSSDLASYITGTMIDISGGKFATQFPQTAYENP